MSWLGVNLNDGINSIKGQLSSITRTVLSEDLEDIDGDESQVIVPRDRIKELEALCQLQKHELEEGRRAREEVEERLHVAHLTTAQQTSTLRSQLHQTQTELHELREKASEWGWDAEEVNTVSLNTNTANHYPQHCQQQQDQQQQQQQQQDLDQFNELAKHEQLNQKVSALLIY
ncbi:hypothetical protein Pcinc_036028 [Petrolisthes cinctipes]|uniref:Uncharacterized protein n=1 Tax=Petrolisthes cinctipes TaxID=88211 RepID=A0AAE1BVB6_PETCI|nr:hypothetical protein Pcinc_036028 [Petrolisthes cinctipes]